MKKISILNYGSANYSSIVGALKKFNCQIVPVYIERNNKFDFEITINRPISFDEKEDLYTITKSLNEWLEKMIKNKPEQWIWSHNRWKL